MPPHRYKLLYKVELPEKPPTKDELEASNTDFSATDALFAVSLIYPGDGSLSTLFMSFDGRRKGVGGGPAELPDEEWFKIWSLMALRLANSKTLGFGQRALCNSVHEAVRAAILDSQGRDPRVRCPHNRLWGLCPMCFAPEDPPKKARH